MTQAPPMLNLVHESETQRQHVRVQVPGVVEIDGTKTQARFRLIDLSAGGVGFDARNIAFRVGQTCSGRVSLPLHPVEMTIPVRLRIRHVDGGSGRVGASFEELNAAQVAAIRRLVSAYLGGEVVGVGDVLHTLKRDNFTSPRTAPRAPRRGLLAGIRAATATIVMLVIGGSALVYTGHRVSEKLLSVTSTAGRVGAPQYQVKMPRDGVFRSLVPADGVVRRGAPIGTFESSMLDLVRGQALKSDLGAREIDDLLDRSIKGTITSPCDCRVQALYVADEQYVGKGEELASLQPLEFEPYVVARFEYPGAETLSVGSPVDLHISGEALQREGRVTQLRTGSDPEAFDDSVVVVVRPDEPIARELVSRPVKVSVRDDAGPIDATLVPAARAQAPVQPAQDPSPDRAAGDAAH